MTILNNENAFHEENRNAEHFCKQNEDAISPSEQEEKKVFYKRFMLE